MEHTRERQTAECLLRQADLSEMLARQHPTHQQLFSTDSQHQHDHQLEHMLTSALRSSQSWTNLTSDVALSSSSPESSSASTWIAAASLVGSSPTSTRSSRSNIQVEVTTIHAHMSENQVHFSVLTRFHICEVGNGGCRLLALLFIADRLGRMLLLLLFALLAGHFLFLLLLLC